MAEDSAIVSSSTAKPITPDPPIIHSDSDTADGGSAVAELFKLIDIEHHEDPVTTLSSEPIASELTSAQTYSYAYWNGIRIRPIRHHVDSSQSAMMISQDELVNFQRLFKKLGFEIGEKNG